MTLGNHELYSGIKGSGYCVYQLGNCAGYILWRGIEEDVPMKLDEEELEAEARELWQATLEKVRLDKDAAGIELAKQIVKLDADEKWRRKNWQNQ